MGGGALFKGGFFPCLKRGGGGPGMAVGVKGKHGGYGEGGEAAQARKETWDEDKNRVSPGREGKGRRGENGERTWDDAARLGVFSVDVVHYITFIS